MASIVTCACGKSFKAKPELAGKLLKCPACGKGIQVPTAGASAQPARATPAQTAIAVTCQCGSSFKAPPSLAGKQVACPTCKNSLAIPDPNAAPPSDDIFGNDPLGDLGTFSPDPLTFGAPAASGAMPSYGAAPSQRPATRTKKPGRVWKAVLYTVLGIFGVIFLTCAGLIVGGVVVGVKQGIDESNGVWKPHVSLTGGYAVMMPGRVTVERRTAEFANFTSPAEDSRARAINGDEVYITVCYNMPAREAGKDSWAEDYAGAVMEDIRDVTRTTATVAGRDAIKLVGTLELDGNSAHEVRWIFMGNNCFFDVSVGNSEHPPSEESTSKLIDSFRFVGANLRPNG